jgi:hypothetical protein
MVSRETARCGILPDDRLTPGLEPIFPRHFALFVSRVKPRKAPAPGSSSAQASQHMVSLPAPASGWASFPTLCAHLRAWTTRPSHLGFGIPIHLGVRFK